MRRDAKTCGQAVLVGFMGAGKSSVGKILAERLAAEFFDVDERIEETAGKGIGEIFASYGEESFREMERAAVRDAVSVPGRVVAAGGGAFVDEANRRALKAYAPVIFLEVSVESVLERLSGDLSRPLFAGGEKAGTLRELMEKRRSSYEQADFRVPTDHRTVREIVDRILSLLTRNAGPRGEGERP